MSQNVPELGKLIEGNANRDAIHVAIEPVLVVRPTQPGSHVGVVDFDREKGLFIVGVEGDYLGIIDPFLNKWVNPGEVCFMLLYQNTITNLRHVWTLPGLNKSEWLNK